MSGNVYLAKMTSLQKPSTLYMIKYRVKCVAVIYTHKNTPVCMCVCMYVYIYIYIYMCVCVCVYLYTIRYTPGTAFLISVAKCTKTSVFSLIVQLSLITCFHINGSSSISTYLCIIKMHIQTHKYI